MTDLSLEVYRTIQAPIEKVFNAWLDPQMLTQFIRPRDDMTIPKAESDAKEGGRFTIIMEVEGKEIPHAGEYKTIAPHSQIVFTWESPFSIEGSTVTINFSEKDGGTHVQLIHVKFPSEESRSNHEGGWGNILKHLELHLT